MDQNATYLAIFEKSFKVDYMLVCEVSFSWWRGDSVEISMPSPTCVCYVNFKLPKCNVGPSWCVDTVNSGAAWLARDCRGRTLLSQSAGRALFWPVV